MKLCGRNFHKQTFENMADVTCGSNEEVSEESIHLLRTEDFKTLGVGLADARLLVEKYRMGKKATDLAEMVAAVRCKKKADAANKKPSKISVSYMWYHWNDMKKDYGQMRLSKGGGMRTRQVDKNMLLKDIFEDMKAIYFPKNKSKQGHLNLMITKMMSGDMTEIKELTACVGEHVESKALSKAKFILSSRPFKFSNDYQSLDVSSDSDFEVEPVALHRSTPKVEKGTQPAVSVETRDELITRQNKEYDESLKADQLKENQKKRTQEIEANKKEMVSKREEYLISRQNIRKHLVPPEPSLAEDSTVIVINHVALGRQKRLFHSDSPMEDVYNWVGSLAVNPEVFELCINAPGQGISTLCPHDKVRKAEQQVLMMRETNDSNLTIDIISGSNIPVANDVAMVSPELKKKEFTVRCPICGEKKSTDIIEKHADECAAEKYVDVTENELSEDDSDLIEMGKCSSTTLEPVKLQSYEILEALKLALNTCSVDQTTVTKLKVRRSHCFEDFCERVSKPWLKSKLGCMFSIHFFGEAGIDQGGLLRDFFSECLEDAYSELFSDCVGGKAPNSKLYEDVANGKFKFAGQLMASSLCLSGPAPNILAPWVYNYIVGGMEHCLTELPDRLIEIDDLCKAYNKVSLMQSHEIFHSFCLSDDGLNTLSEIGFKGVPSKVDINSKSSIMRSIFMKVTLQSAIPALQQIVEGLKLYGLLDVIHSQPDVLRYAFTPFLDLEWVFETLENDIEAVYSNDGSTLKSKEINTFKALMDAMEDMYHEDTALFKKLMKFMTGSPSVPPLGLPRNIRVLFVHACPTDCRCKPYVSTCDLCVNIAVHYNTKSKMYIALKDSVGMSRGFDDV